ncbi:hypothetical protein HK104_011246 [Borealophlyctis nickersoniae]|nr:hypothetical protein HK104_011246 [Borealophlyctis nickersoniae]
MSARTEQFTSPRKIPYIEHTICYCLHQAPVHALALDNVAKKCSVRQSGLMRLARTRSSVAGQGNAPQQFDKVVFRADQKDIGSYKLQIPLRIPPAPPTSSLDPVPENMANFQSVPEVPQTFSVNAETTSPPPPATHPGSAEICRLKIRTNESLADFILHLSEEYPSIGDIRATRGQFEEIERTDEVPITEFLRGNVVVWYGDGSNSASLSSLTQGALTVDRGQAFAQLSDAQSKLVILETELGRLGLIQQEIEQAVGVRYMAFKFGVLTYLGLQFGTMLYLTIELGWDFTEPVACLLTLATMVVSSGTYVAIRREPSYSNLGQWVRDTFRHRLVTRHKFDRAQYDTLNAGVERLRRLVTEARQVAGVGA